MLEAPEESYAPEDARSVGPSVSPEVAVREPAPAGALHRGAAGAFAGGRDTTARDEEAYVPRRAAGGVRFKFKMAVPGSTAGKIVGICAVLFVIGAALTTVVGVRRYLMHDDRFAVATSSEIEILGNEHLTRPQILSVFGADLERNIFKVPLAERRADLERLPWVAHATVMRLLPNHLRIAVTERVPIAFVRQGTELGLVDAHGVLLDMPEQSAGHYSFPVLTGLSASDPLDTRAARMAVYQKFINELDGSGQKLSQNLSEVDVSNPENVKALVANNGRDVLVHFGDEKFLERYKMFQQHLPEWEAQYPKLASADMRYEQQVVLEMQPGAGVASADAAPAATPVAEIEKAAPAKTEAVAAAPAPKTVPKPALPAAAKVVAPRTAIVRVRKPIAVKPLNAKAAAHQAMLAKIAQARAANVSNTVAGQGAR